MLFKIVYDVKQKTEDGEVATLGNDAFYIVANTQLEAIETADKFIATNYDPAIIFDKKMIFELRPGTVITVLQSQEFIPTEGSSLIHMTGFERKQ